MSANGVMHCPLETLRTTLSKCHEWQKWQGKNYSESQALTRIHYDSLPAPGGESVQHTLAELNTYRPYIILTDGGEGGFSVVRVADGGGFTQRGVIIAEINEAVPDSIAQDHAEVRKRLRVSLGKLVRSLDITKPGLAELCETPGCLFWHRCNIVGPARTTEDELGTLGDAQRAWLEIHWGHVQ
jgi:hypothetical protein